MNKLYQELSNRAIKGDRDAMHELFALAKQCEAENNFQEATVAFREAAIAFRVSSYGNVVRAEEAESKAEWLSKVRDIYQKWIEDNPNGLRKLPYSEPGFSHDRIRDVVLQLLHEDTFVSVFRFLQKSLASMGVEFFSPGGSIQRRTNEILTFLFGHKFDMRSKYFRYLQNTSVRICMDLIADEVVKRCRSSQ